MDDILYRHELKFVCSENSIHIMEDRIKHICKLDPYVGPRGEYVIRSLYFDTYDDDCFRDGMEGVENRKKFRIRIYDGSSKMIKLECKHSHRGMKAKSVCRITEKQCESLIEGKTILETDASQELLRRFLWERNTKLLTPKVIVEYARTPYVYTTGNVRITFDRNIGSSSEVKSFLREKIPRKGILPIGQQLLEVKYDEVLPAPITELLAVGQQLNRTSFSKYVLCRKYGIR